MKKFLKALLIIVIFSFAIVFLKKHYLKDYNIVLKDNNMEWNLKYKGLKDAIDFTIDSKGDYYICYKTKIQYIDKDGKSFNIFADKNMNISSIEYYKEKLYFSSNCCVYYFDLHSKECKEIISNLPNFGDYKDSILKVNGDYLYITIGAATNSGVVGEDNEWLKNNPYNHDVSPHKIVLRGINFANGKNGAFVNYGTKNIEGQIISGHFPGNASIMMYNLETGDSTTYAWGIRNIKGLDFDSRERMIASVGGMEDRGLRPVKGDTDYIYVIKPKSWYGWPDYSGGDPINSPKFKGANNKTVSFILDNHTTTNPAAPLYVHNSLATLKSIAIDKEGGLGEADSIYFYDEKDKKLWYLNEKGVMNEKLKFNNESKISSIKYIKNQIIILDCNQGNLYSLGLKEKNEVSINKKPIIYFLLISILIVIISMLKMLVDSWHKGENN
ncbi:hypothetical protein [Clostridium ganghwense]|uniref:Glucose/Sorbosone dehydrogenase domain-containing protein n=1 Tax=Clostridium ganghwense TaxID=312089 RepID=A0ABT4CP70_9CLOT|nr:hypothetical protein [Clostridium ganghwense]MCY6370849.1 hypothetical protein [Clostridium ganghwense]